MSELEQAVCAPYVQGIEHPSLHEIMAELIALRAAVDGLQRTVSEHVRRCQCQMSEEDAERIRKARALEKIANEIKDLGFNGG